MNMQTRIVTLKDGVILDDTNPFHVEKQSSQYKKMGKTSMSLLTSLSLSFNNLKTKKGRTIFNFFCWLYWNHWYCIDPFFVKWSEYVYSND